MKLLLKNILVWLLVLPAMAHAEDSWDFRLTPYLWFAGIEGDVSTLPGAPVVPVDISSSDALSDTEASFMLVFEAKKNKHGVLFDFLYSDVQSTEDLIPEISLTMKSISKTTIFSTAYIYEVYKANKQLVDIMAGARYWDIDTELNFGGGFGILESQRIRDSESWVDPLLGIKARSQLGESKFYAAGWLAAGGFGVGAENFYDVSANIGYQWNKAIGTSLGYRLYNVDYEEGDFVYDVQQEGWILGLNWAF